MTRTVAVELMTSLFQFRRATIAIAIAALSICTHAYAQSSLVVYGQIDIGMRHVTQIDGTQSLDYMSSSGLSPTYIGFKGTEALSPDVNVFYKMESQFSADDGALGNIGSGTPLFGREALIGVSGDWGSLSVGRQYNALSVFFGYNPVWVDGASPIYVAGDNMLLGYRIDNAVVYKKRQGNVSVQLDYAPGEQAGSTARGRTTGGNISYDAGGDMAGVGFDDYQAANGIDRVRNWTAGGRLKTGASTSLYIGHLGSDAAGNSAIRRKLTFAGVQEQLTERLLLAAGVYRYWQSACFGTCVAGLTVNQGGNGSRIMGFSSGAAAGNGRIVAVYARYALSLRTALYVEADRYMMRDGAAQDQVYYWSGRLDKNLSKVNQTGLMAGLTHSF